MVCIVQPSEENAGHLLAVLPSLLHLDRASDIQDETDGATNETTEATSSPFPLFLTATVAATAVPVRVPNAGRVPYS